MDKVEFPVDKPCKILSCKVKEGFYLPIGHVIYTYTELDDDNQRVVRRLKATQSGVIKQILVKAGQQTSKGTTLMTLDACTHPTVMKDMCAECGIDLRKLDEIKNKTASVSMIHSVPDLRISMEQAQIIGKDDEERLLKQKKLVLLVDLDQTLIHTTNDNVPNNIKDVFHFQLWGHGSMWYHTRLRPKTNEFLERIEKLYELHICTFGTRSYAHMIARHLDPHGKYFSDRILSRDECFSQNSKTANLKELFPRGDGMVCIIDDREDVWNYAPNLIHVKPYHFFRHTGDINAPPGLTKQDEDDKTGVSFTKDGVVPSTTENLIPPPPPAPPEDNENNNIKEVTSDLSLSDEESAGEKSEANDGDKEESADETIKINKDDLDKEEEEEEKSDTIAPHQKEQICDNPKIEQKVEPIPEAASNSNSVEMKESNNKKCDDEQSTKEEENKTTTDDKVKDTKVSNEEGTNLIDVEDPDDYLMDLEQILRSIHEAYYSLQSDMRSGEVPDVKNVIPYVRKKVLKNVSIVFSGVIPTEVPLSERKNTRAYSVALSLGAQISEKIIPPNKASSSNEIPSTHVVAARIGTAKVNEARRYKGIHIVTPDWLWCCSERWEHVDERLFQLYSANNKNKCFNTKMGSSQQHKIQGKPMMRKERTASGRFMDSINPLLSFSMDEIESMGHEVDDICNESESSSSSSDDDTQDKIAAAAARRRRSKSHDVILNKEFCSDSSTSMVSESGCGDDLVIRKRRRNTKNKTEEETTEDEPLNVKFRRGEPVPSEVEHLMNNSEEEDQDETMQEDNDDDDDVEEEWMAQALEREFLDESSRD